MTAQEFKAGERVDIHIKGARVVNTYPRRDGSTQIGAIVVARYGTDADCTRSVAVNTMASEVTVERVAPTGWPPRAGDVWNDQDDTEGACDWHVLPQHLGNAEVLLHVDSTSPPMTPDDFRRDYPNARLVRRREAS